MILIDACVWITHFRRPLMELFALVERNEAATHPFVVGEVAMGSLGDRRETLRSFTRLPTLNMATHGEVMALIEWRQLFGRGIGWVDAHLLAATLTIPGATLWTIDKRLYAQAERLGVAYVGST